MSAAAAAAVPAPADKYQALLGAVDSVIPSAKQELAREVTAFLGPSIIYTLGSETLRDLVDAPVRTYRDYIPESDRHGGSPWTVGINTHLYECRCLEWGRMPHCGRPAPRGIFEMLLVKQISDRFPDRTQELHLCVIATAGNLQILRILSLLIVLAHYSKFRLTLIDWKFICPHRCPCDSVAYEDALTTFIREEITDIDPFRQTQVAVDISTEKDDATLLALNGPGRTPPHVLMLYDLGAKDGWDLLTPVRETLDKIRFYHSRSDTLLAFSYFPTMYFCTFDRLASLDLEAPNRPDVSYQPGAGAPLTTTLVNLDGSIAESLAAHRVH